MRFFNWDGKLPLRSSDEDVDAKFGVNQVKLKHERMAVQHSSPGNSRLARFLTHFRLQEMFKSFWRIIGGCMHLNLGAPLPASL
jgi:hypothetical protein